MGKEDVIKKLNEQLPILRKNYHLKNIGLFGSFVRNEAGADSDIDILVEFNEPIGLFKFIELENHLSDLLKKKVDLVSKKALKPAIGKQILKEVINI